MANQIRLNRASGSDPGASDLVTGELAVRTDTAKLFTKKDDNSVVEIGATVGADSVGTSAIQDDAVTQAKLANNSVGSGELKSTAVTTAKITDANVTLAKLATDSVGTDKIIASAVTTAKIADDAVTTAKIADDAITTAKIGSEQITASEIAGGTLTTGKLADDAVTYAKIQNVTANRLLGRDVGAGTGVLTELTPANVRNILNVADGATNVTNTNQLTNGAGFITATLTEEQVEDFVGGMVSGNTETGITVTYQDSDGTLDFVVASQTDENFTTTLKNKLDGIESNATADQTASEILTLLLTVDGTSSGIVAQSAGFVDVSGITTNADLQVVFSTSNDGSARTLACDSTNSKFTYNPSSNTLTVDTVVGALTGNAATATKLATARTIAGVSFDGSANISLNNNAITNGAGYITSADGGNAATLDSIDSSQFLRSDTSDSGSGLLSLSAGIAFTDAAKCTAAVSALSDGSTITVDFTSGIHHSVTLGGNRTFGNPSNDGSAVGQCGSIFITQDGTGGRTASFHSDYKFVGGTAPTLSTSANAVDRLDYIIKASGVIHCVVSLDIK